MCVFACACACACVCVCVYVCVCVRKGGLYRLHAIIHIYLFSYLLMFSLQGDIDMLFAIILLQNDKHS